MMNASLNLAELATLCGSWMPTATTDTGPSHHKDGCLAVLLGSG